MLTRRDVKRLLASVLDSAREGDFSLHANLDSLYYRQLSGGFSGSFVALIWVEGLPSLILKAGPVLEIHEEIEKRAKFSSPAILRLRSQGLDVASAAVDVEVNQHDELWAAMLYAYIGGLSYDEIQHFGDFQDIFDKFVNGREFGTAPTELLLTEWVERLFLRVRENEVEGGNESASSVVRARPMSVYLPSLKWGQGLAAVLETAATFGPNSDDLIGFRIWWEDKVTEVSVAAYPAMARIHGDLRFANVMVDTRTSQVELIDFGNSRVGHVFQDLARFECDLLLNVQDKTVTNAGHSPEAATLSVLKVALTERFGEIDPQRDTSSRHLAALRILRNVYEKHWRILSNQGRRRMYTWFLLAELLKRLTWVSDSVDSRRRILVAAITMIKRVIDGQSEVDAKFSAVEDIGRILNCVRAYIPIRKFESAVNRDRNQAKLAALRKAVRNQENVRLIAETGHSYFHFRGPFRPEVEALASSGSFSAVIANPYFVESHGISKAYKDAEEFGDLVHPLLERKFTESIYGYERLAAEFPNNVRMRIARFGLGMTLLITEDRLFFEPYFRSDRLRRHEKLFDTFEFEFDASNGHVRSLFDEHFEFHFTNGASVVDVRDKSERIKHLLRLAMDEM